MPANQNDITEILKTVKYPGFSRDIVSFGLVKDIKVEGENVVVKLELTAKDHSLPPQIKKAVEDALAQHPQITSSSVFVNVKKPEQSATPDENSSQLQKVRYTIAIASGKGGVGKSTTSVNLACALEKILSAEGKKNAVGLMDCDIYGPSIPQMLGINQRPEIAKDLIQPLRNFGVRIMSMGLLIDEMTPVVWRGPMIMKTIQQFAQNVDWGELEILVVDLPPGTGDAQLSLVQTIPLDGAVIITTPQSVAYQVARRGAMMFEKVSVPILGVVENMSYLLQADGSKNYLFGEGGGQITADHLTSELLGSIPLEKDIREGADQGIPLPIQQPEHDISTQYAEIAQSILKKLRKEK